VKRVYILVEGQTEEIFISDLLAPHYAEKNLYLQPITVETCEGYGGGKKRGGYVSYARLKKQLLILLRDESAHVSTMFDLYALPKDRPGMKDEGFAAMQTGREKAEFIEKCWKEEIAHPRFIPHLSVHEFEALLFADTSTFNARAHGLDFSVLHQIGANTAPEDINDSRETAPSKRILSVFPQYQKARHGPLIAADIGLPAMRAACPHFDAWLRQLESL
jgi:Domain of unknown function (DUF4276)